MAMRGGVTAVLAGGRQLPYGANVDWSRQKRQTSTLETNATETRIPVGDLDARVAGSQRSDLKPMDVRSAPIAFTGKRETPHQNVAMVAPPSDELVLCETMRKVRTHSIFRFTRAILVLVSLFAPGVFSYYNVLDPAVQLAMLEVSCALVVVSSIFNLVVVLDNRSPPHRKSWKHSALWLAIEIAKWSLIVAGVIEYRAQDWSNAFDVNYFLLFLLVLEALIYYGEIFHAPRHMWELLIARYHSIAWVGATLLLIVYAYAVLGFYLFHQLTLDDFAEQNITQPLPYFSTITDSVITLLGFMNWFDSVLVRSFNGFYQGAAFYFISFTVVSTYTLANLFMAVIVTVLADFAQAPRAAGGYAQEPREDGRCAQEPRGAGGVRSGSP